MGRGLSQRRRVNNYERARQAKSGTIPLPPPPEEVQRLNNKNKKKKNRQDGSQAPASFRRMMRVKAFVERKNPQGAPAEQQMSAAERKNKFRGGAAGLPGLKGVSAAGPISGLMGSPEMRVAADAEAAESSGREDADSVGEREPEGSKNLPDKPDAATLYGIKKPMKQQKRDFLEKRKQRKRGRGGSEEDGEGSLEASVMTDRHKPAFGEQAMQPLKVNLKRKHWKGEDSAEQTSQRLKGVFQRQMKDAEALNKRREAEKASLAEAFREQKRAKNNAVAKVATAATLAALVKRNADAAGDA